MTEKQSSSDPSYPFVRGTALWSLFFKRDVGSPRSEVHALFVQGLGSSSSTDI